MRKYVLITIVLMGLAANSGQCQTIDTLLDVGGYRLHFRILKGKGMPILFEGGSQADVSVWDTILKPVADVTHATLTYDRPGDGNSELDTSNHDLNRHGILQVIEGLEKTYASTQSGQEANEIRKRFLSYALEAVNEEKRKEAH